MSSSLKTDTKQRGFTIIELMFATVIFSVILLISLSALVQIGRLYYKGVTTAQTQETARDIMDQITQGIEFSGSEITATTLSVGPKVAVGSPAQGFFCIGGTRYSYMIDRQMSDHPTVANKQIRHVLWADDLPACASAVTMLDLTKPNPSTDSTPASGTNGRELMGSNMRISQLTMKLLTVDKSTWQIQMSLAYGDEDLLGVDTSTVPNRILCQGERIGTQFCATTELSSIVKRRISVQ